MSINTVGFGQTGVVDAASRAGFVRRTYYHLAGAVLAFVGIEYLLLQTSLGPLMLEWMGGGQYRWLGILGAFVLATWFARSIAAASDSVPLQYLGLAAYVLAEALIFVPILFIAVHYASPKVLPMAAIMTLMLFGGLTSTAITTRSDFSFLGAFLKMGFFVALGLIVCSTIFGFDLGMVFSGGMIILAMAAILYDTGKILHTYPTDRHVSAALELFASVALLFWYMLRLMMAVSRR